jgi:phosphatidylglycerophosphatase A
VLIATVAGVGRTPVAPGTAASALTALLLWIAPVQRAWLAVFLVLVIVAGTWAAHVAERALGVKDPGAIVVDEVAGMALSVAVLPLTASVLAVAFVFFRIFDVLKPFPADVAQRLPGGLGIMVDDLVAGVYALAVVAVLRAGLGWP